MAIQLIEIGLCVAAAMLAAIEIFRTRGQSNLPWAVLLLAVGIVLLLGR